MELRLLAVVVAPLSARKRLPDTPGGPARQNEKEAKMRQGYIHAQYTIFQSSGEIGKFVLTYLKAITCSVLIKICLTEQSYS